MTVSLYLWAAVTVGVLLWAQCDRRCTKEEWIRIIGISATWVMLIPGSFLWLLLENMNIPVKEKFETLIAKVKFRFN